MDLLFILIVVVIAIVVITMVKKSCDNKAGYGEHSSKNTSYMNDDIEFDDDDGYDGSSEVSGGCGVDGGGITDF